MIIIWLDDDAEENLKEGHHSQETEAAAIKESKTWKFRKRKKDDDKGKHMLYN